MKTVLFLPGDGIGPEVAGEAEKTLLAASRKFNLGLTAQTALVGGAAIDATGGPLPEETLAACRAADAVFLGAVGGPAWDSVPREKRPEQGLLRLRKALNVFANLRPVAVFPELASFSRLRPDLVAQGVDLLVVRELTGGIYFGPGGEETENNVRKAWDVMPYDETEIRRIAVIAFDAARKRRKKVCSVDKANVLRTSRLWRAVVTELAQDYPDVILEHMYVDNAAMQLVARPADFDVILTENLFGDILSDQAAAVAGSLGMLASASLGAENPGIFEPAHGSAPDIAGQDKANPLASILSVAMMLRLAFNETQAADAVDNAVRAAVRDGYRTPDLIPATGGVTPVSCSRMGELVRERL